MGWAVLVMTVDVEVAGSGPGLVRDGLLNLSNFLKMRFMSLNNSTRSNQGDKREERCYRLHNHEMFVVMHRPILLTPSDIRNYDP